MAHGFQRAQVRDVADVLGIGKGALYGYATGELALFCAALRYADGVEPLPDRSLIPVAPAQPDATTGPKELVGVVSDLFRRLSANRVAIKLVDRCAQHRMRLPWRWSGAGCNPTRDTAATFTSAGFDTDALRRIEVPGMPLTREWITGMLPASDTAS